MQAYYRYNLPAHLLLLLAILSASFACLANNQTQTDLVRVADDISQIIASNHYNPTELLGPQYLQLQEDVKHAARAAQSQNEFISNFNTLWKEGPFSHVNLAVSERNAAATADFYDSFKIGGGGAKLTWQADIAVLTVNTMMGSDTIEEIAMAYRDIASKGAKALIIDLRQNEGGAFAIVPLVSHLLTQALDSGMFVSRQWNSAHQKPPTKQDILALKPWSGWSIKSFWRDVQAVPLTRIQFVPMAPHFGGPVYLLTSQKSASATEFAIDALANLPQVTIIGERSAGKMLSQKMFDVTGSLLLSLPIADYYSTRVGRIEGKGIAPDIAVPANAAMEMAMAIANGADPTTVNIEENIDKITDNTPLYLFGSMNNWGKNWSDTPKFDYRGNGHYVAKIQLKQGTWEFKIAPMNWSFDYGAKKGSEAAYIGNDTKLIKQANSKNITLTVKNDTELEMILNISTAKQAMLLIDSLKPILPCTPSMRTNQNTPCNIY
ncbi:S41 family peptidase [Paraglaciecola sp. 25GB23A]|uniref:S41 family peptidase n=1 Tax=Paraglaciecola sp. 25GB23A TaxID=3156068 RepID=UPI0032AFE654